MENITVYKKGDAPSLQAAQSATGLEIFDKIHEIAQRYPRNDMQLLIDAVNIVISLGQPAILQCIYLKPITGSNYKEMKGDGAKLNLLNLRNTENEIKSTSGTQYAYGLSVAFWEEFMRNVKYVSYDISEAVEYEKEVICTYRIVDMQTLREVSGKKSRSIYGKDQNGKPLRYSESVIQNTKEACRSFAFRQMCERFFGKIWANSIIEKFLKELAPKNVDPRVREKKVNTIFSSLASYGATNEVVLGHFGADTINDFYNDDDLFIKLTIIADNVKSVPQGARAAKVKEIFFPEPEQPENKIQVTEIIDEAEAQKYIEKAEANKANELKFTSSPDVNDETEEENGLNY